MPALALASVARRAQEGGGIGAAAEFDLTLET